MDLCNVPLRCHKIKAPALKIFFLIFMQRFDKFVHLYNIDEKIIKKNFDYLKKVFIFAK